MTEQSSAVLPTNFNPWLEIWYRPRTTIRRIVQWYPKRGVYILAAVAGYVQYLNRASSQALGDNMDLIGVLGLGLIVGTIGGIVSLAISTFGVGFVAQRLGGEADTDETMTALAWGQAPALFSLAFWILQIVLLQGDVFKSEISLIEANPIVGLLFIPLVAAGILILLGQSVLTVLTVAEVNRFSIWRSIASILLGGLVILLPFLLCFGSVFG